jgi:ABC-type transport system involved in cytochrome c biogenesis permease subunit
MTTGTTVAFDRWATNLARTRRGDFSEFENEALELANKVWLYQKHRAGERLYVLPKKDDPDQHWTSIAELIGSDFDEQTSTPGVREAREHFQRARAAYLAGSAEAFGEATRDFLAAVRRIGPKLDRTYPRQITIALEVAYNRWALFTVAWLLSSCAFLCFVAGIVTRSKAFSIAGLALFAASLAAMLLGFGLRAAISGRVPVTNLYESVVFAGLGALLFGLVFGLWARKQYVFAAAAVVATFALVLADYCPSVLDPRIRPLMPVLRSNFWLAVHVITIMLSYAAFALAWAIGNLTLSYYLVGSEDRQAIVARARLTYKTLKTGVLLLVVGTILGALWADYSWGRFWGWDPKEVWALITLLGYVALLHARPAGWIGHRGTVAWSVLCFCLVVITWYIANMLPGLHEYGLAGGGQLYVWTAMGLQLAYVLAAVVRSAMKKDGVGSHFASEAS